MLEIKRSEHECQRVPARPFVGTLAGAAELSASEPYASALGSQRSRLSLFRNQYCSSHSPVAHVKLIKIDGRGAGCFTVGS